MLKCDGSILKICCRQGLQLLILLNSILRRRAILFKNRGHLMVFPLIKLSGKTIDFQNISNFKYFLPRSTHFFGLFTSSTNISLFKLWNKETPNKMQTTEVHLLFCFSEIFFQQLTCDWISFHLPRWFYSFLVG